MKKQESERLPRMPPIIEDASRESSLEHHDEVSIIFDWEIPLGTPTLLTFIAEIQRHDERSRIRFELDLSRLASVELAKMRGILAARHANIDDAVSVTRAVTWLLELSIHQAQPHLSLDERQRKVRQLLLSCERTPFLKE